MTSAEKRKFRYGGTGAALTVVFIAAVILVNAVFSVLCTRYALYAVMTTTGYFGISDRSRELLADVDDEIKFIFCTPLDKLSDNTTSSMIYTLAQAYAAEYDNISCDYLNYETETARTQSYMITSGSTINAKTVIVDCPARNSYRVYSWDSFIAYDTDGYQYGFNGELKFTSAILQLTGEHPVVAFTKNHSEDITGAAALMSLFENAGYDTVTFDLTSEPIPDGTRIIVTFDPRTDFIGMGAEQNEFEKLNAFTADYGHLMVFLSAGRGTLPELYSYLYEHWYIEPSNYTVSDTAQNSLSADGRAISATYVTDGVGAGLTKTLRSMQSTPRALVENSLALSLAPGAQTENSSINSSLILTSSPEAVAYDNGQSVGSGTYGLLALSCYSTYVDNEQKNNYVLVSGSSQFASNDNLNSASYANSDILYSAMTAMGKDKVPSGIECKKFEDAKLDITSAQANTRTVIFAVIIPALLMLAGLFVYIRRKHL